MTTGAVSLSASLSAINRSDPRYFQIAALSSFLLFGLTQRAFDIRLFDMVVIFAAALATQAIGARSARIPFEAKSAVITALSLTLLLRADGVLPLAAAAIIAIGSKFLLRARGKHLFNPANIGIVAVTLATNAAWTTPGQWGSAVWLAAIIAGVGVVVASRAARLDVPLIFLATFSALVIGRALWLGDPLAIPLNRLQNGALILFAFFMISDPKTTPDGFAPRLIFTAATAGLAFHLIYYRYQADGLFWALTLACLVRPLMEHADRSPRYQWSAAPPFPIRRSPKVPAE